MLADSVIQPKWSYQDAIALIVKIEAIAPKYNCHVGMTGGVLYKGGMRKDLDILFYLHDRKSVIDEDGLLKNLGDLGITVGKYCGWVTKATYQGKAIDLMFPHREEKDGYKK